jgi:hypothetical protein
MMMWIGNIYIFFYNKIILRRCTPINNFGDSADTSGYMEVFHDYY